MKHLLRHLSILTFAFYANGMFYVPPISKDSNPIRTENEDVHLNTVELIHKYGYPSEIHEITTDDGYILTMHRIPFSHKNCGGIEQCSKKKIPVYLQHGFVCSSAGWIMNSPDKALPYRLADAGYDVWLGNFRGNIYSMRHVEYSPEQNIFWDFTYEQMGLFDVPAMVNYILKVTGHDKLFYIGHSMGNTAFYIAASSVPKFEEKIISAFALAPVAFIEYIQSPFMKVAIFAQNENIALSTFGHQKFVPERVLELIRTLGVDICNPKFFINAACEGLMFSLAGFDPHQVNKTWFPVLLGHYPDITSTRTFIHFLQTYNERRFCRYNHGRKQNLEIYGTSTPPDYDLSAVKAKVILVWAENDYMANPKDVKRLEALLPNVKSYKVTDENFNHIDFLNGVNSDQLIYNPVMNMMKALA